MKVKKLLKRKKRRIKTKKHKINKKRIKRLLKDLNNPEKKIKNVDFKGKITIDIKEDSDYIYVTIVDNGIGFNHVDKAKMLTPYFTTKKDGTGLGLAVVTKIISDHNSSILFETISDGAKVEIIVPQI